jgi:FKBP-type peptidyl-prolyl cis-trans isomerase
MRSVFSLSFLLVVMLMRTDPSVAFSLPMTTEQSSRRAFFTKTVATAGAAVVTTSAAFSQPAIAAPEILKTPNGIKYAILKPAKEKGSPFDKDIVAVEYTAYLTDGTIFGT